MRSTKARTLNGGVTMERTARAKNEPKRPSDSSRPSTRSPSSSNGRRTAQVGASAIEGSAVDPERPEGKARGVEGVLEHEDAGQSRSVPPRVFPRAARTLCLQEITDAAADHA